MYYPNNSRRISPGGILRINTVVPEMNSPEMIANYYLGEFHEGRADAAFHGLIEAHADIVPVLIRAYERTKDTDAKAFLIDVVSHFRLDSSLDFLRQALSLNEPRIWKFALDGLVMAESHGAVDAMERVLSSVTDSNKKAWIDEAISDTKAAIHQAQQAGTGQPATRPVVEPKDSYKPQPDAEGRSR